MDILLSEEEFLKLKCDMANDEVGTLENYDCPTCKNKGLIYMIRNGSIVVKDCECAKKRRIINEMLDSGITKEMLDRYSFDTYETGKDYQKTIYNKAIKYVENADNKWFYFGGISGIGKTHICTAIFKALIEKGMTGKYLLWKNELPKLKTMRKSFNEITQDNYYKIINDYTNVDVLYIDDFLKFLDTRTNDDLDIAYEIINARYCNNKITIISSELDKEELGKVDLAICGRISEKSKEYFIQPLKSLDRNYRLQ